MDELTYHACPFLAYAVKLDLGQKGLSPIISVKLNDLDKKAIFPPR